MPEEFCPKCGAARTAAFRFCRSCGFDFDSISSITTPNRTAQANPVAASDPQVPSAAPRVPAAPAPEPLRKKSSSLSAWIALVAVALVALWAWGALGKPNAGTSGASPANDGTDVTTTKNLTGTFQRWEPVDDAHGYAYFTVTNHGTASATAECTVEVRDDFGDFGFDILVGENVGPGKTFSGRMALSVGKGSFLVNKGEVKNC